MTDKTKKKIEPENTIKVFRLLGIESDEDRQRFRQLADLGRLGTNKKEHNPTPADTRNNTVTDKGDAELEPTS